MEIKSTNYQLTNKIVRMETVCGEKNSLHGEKKVIGNLGYEKWT